MESPKWCHYLYSSPATIHHIIVWENIALEDKKKKRRKKENCTSVSETKRRTLLRTEPEQIGIIEIEAKERKEGMNELGGQ